MLFKIHDEVTPVEPIIILKLQRSLSGIMLCAVDNDGYTHAGGNLLRFCFNGRIERIEGVSDKLGLFLDAAAGRIVIT